MSVRRKKGREIIIREPGLADDYEKAERSERLAPERPVTAEEVRGDTSALDSFKRRGKVTRTVRRPHVTYYLGEQLDLISEELKALKERQSRTPGGLPMEDLRRMTMLNEMMGRIFREEREQVKLEHFEEMEEGELEAQLLELAEGLKSGE